MSLDAPTLTPRQRLLDTLCTDLNAQGWDQKPMMWTVHSDDTEEWLVYYDEFTGDAATYLNQLPASKPMPTDATGIVIAVEAWAYPDRLTRTFANGGEQRAFQRLLPPSEHPERIELRHLLFIGRDGEVTALTYRDERGGIRTWEHTTTPGAVGDPVVDAARAVLGVSFTDDDDTDAAQLERALTMMSKTLARAASGQISKDAASLEIVHALPEQMRPQLIRVLPEDVRTQVLRLLPDAERRRYGF